jgi:hypothetical protein
MIKDFPKRPKPASRPQTDVPRLLTLLLYGRFSWLDRLPDGSALASAKELAWQLGWKTSRVRLALERGGEQLLWTYGWHRSSFWVKVKPPIGFERGAAMATEILDIEQEAK